jgi:hypothetical protein
MCTLFRAGGGRTGEGVGGKRPPSLPPMINPLTPPEYRERRDSHTFRPISEREAFYSQPMGRREYSHSGAAMDKLYTAYIRDIYIQTRHSKLKSDTPVSIIIMQIFCRGNLSQHVKQIAFTIQCKRVFC